MKSHRAVAAFMGERSASTILFERRISSDDSSSLQPNELKKAVICHTELASVGSIPMHSSTWCRSACTTTHSKNELLMSVGLRKSEATCPMSSGYFGGG
jgi:hypothetical protein